MLVSQLLVNEWAKFNQNTVISSYEDSVEQLYNEDITKIWQSINLYNDNLALLQQENPFSYIYYDSYDDNYLSLPFEHKEEIGSIIIDKIDLHLPIAHGTLDTTLLKMTGHMYQTSFPCPGNSTHAVIVGHSGLRTSQMFDNLDKLVEGDLIKINFLNKVFTYEVNDIRVELPEECNQYLQIIPNDNLLTLYTCTPYGVNSHRLLVRAKFIDEELLDNKQIPLAITQNNLRAIINCLIIVVLPFILIEIVSFIRKGRSKCQF